MTSDRRYHTTLWRSIRLQVLERDEWRCQVRISPKCAGHANQCDHIIEPIVGGAFFDMSNCPRVAERATWRNATDESTPPRAEATDRSQRP